jgi:hypothetical protein
MSLDENNSIFARPTIGSDVKSAYPHCRISMRGSYVFKTVLLLFYQSFISHQFLVFSALDSALK